MSGSRVLPGRLGDPSLQLRDDRRADPRMIAAFAPLGLDVAPPGSPVTADSPIEEIRAMVALMEAEFRSVDGVFLADAPPVDGVEHETRVITGVDGNDITLFIHHPTEANGPLPCIVHTHGGGMVMLTAADPSYRRWRDELAATGLVVVGVEFRNGAGVLGPHPFPAGLNDCVAAARWVGEHRDELGISTIVISGESGGGNLTLATALMANREGWIDQIAGVYAQCPYIMGNYTNPPAHLVSLTENDGYRLSRGEISVLARVYDPEGQNRTNPLAWPWHATTEDLRGLPPHTISVNQLDPLRDEGLDYAIKLATAGVSVISRTVNGTCHAGDCMLRDALPEVYLGTIRDISGFAYSL